MLARRQQLALNFIDLILFQSVRRNDRPAAGVAVLADDDVAAALVFKVVGERAQGADDCIGIPRRFVLDALALHCAMTQQILQVDRQGNHIEAPGEHAPAYAGKISNTDDIFDKLGECLVPSDRLKTD